MKPEGLYKIKEILKFDENFNKVWVDSETVMADEESDGSDKRMLASLFDFRDDGYVQMLMPLPDDVSKEEADAAVASGEIVLDENNMLVLEKHPWKYEDGKILYDTGIKGEVLREKVSSWIEITDTDGVLELFTYRLVKA